ncbi:putative lipase protein [Eutypa lata UCREL1]|uniref:Putative lipase protein n=1 Tax=Eutypa lata (strain UCR-EL1) TaxID=1287681 RepID=M7SJJ7_EUTLA|nr:putative lipase protein [Eutypa lata UCREL1]
MIEEAVTITNSEVKAFDFYAQYAAAGYCNSESAIGSTVTCSNNACPEVTAAGATIQSTFSGILTDIQGFVSVDDTNKLIVTSFKGSSSIRNWITDFVFLQIPCDLTLGCLLHAGFSTAWEEVADEVLAGVKAAKAANPSYKIIFTGHSLGGAVATVGAGYVREEDGGSSYDIDIYTYGSPRPGNRAFVEHVSEQAGLEFRVTHTDDPVPRLPPILLNYRHTSPEYWFHTGGSNTTDYTAADGEVCEGYASLGCNAGTLGLDVEAHGYYFQDISACGTGIEFRKTKRAAAAANVTFDMATTEPEDVTDEELEARLNDLVAQDIEFVATLEE